MAGNEDFKKEERQKLKPKFKSKRLFITGSSRNSKSDTVLTSSFNEMSKSFANNAYLGPDGINTSAVGGLIYMMNEMKDDIDDIHSEISSSVYESRINSGSSISQIKAFANFDSTPSVIGGSIFTTANTRPTTITKFDNPTEGQQITIIIKDALTDFTNGGVGGKGTGRLVLNGNANWTTATTGDSISFVYNDGAWIEINRSDNT